MKKGKHLVKRFITAGISASMIAGSLGSNVPQLTLHASAESELTEDFSEDIAVETDDAAIEDAENAAVDNTETKTDDSAEQESTLEVKEEGSEAEETTTETNEVSEGEDEEASDLSNETLGQDSDTKENAQEDTDNEEAFDDTKEEMATALEEEELTVTLDKENYPNVHELENINDSSDVNRQSIHDGAILHAFCWNFNTIAEHMEDIADAGFTAIQTSPINACLSTHDAPSLDGTLNGTDGMWYYHYQPTDWTIGNYQLGTREEFINLCNVADYYGIGIIVDILPNHTTPEFAEVSQDLIAAVGGKDNLYHKNERSSMNYSNRVEVTYNDMGGLPDVDTENTDFQDYFYSYLEDCINCGADGFRIDTAKHIALPDDPVPEVYEDEKDRNTFYPNMSNALNEYSEETNRKGYDNLFVYGEVLQGDCDRLAGYQNYIGGTTASNYGSSIRSALSDNNFSVGNIMDYKIYDDGENKADTDKLVTWVESHDNYINDKSYNTVNDADTILGWAIIAARKDGTPLFFSRPNNSSKDAPFGDNVLGAAGNDLYKSKDVAAVNKFRTLMAGKDEYLSNPGGDTHTLMIERMDQGEEDAAGAVIVNACNYPVSISGKTSLADGAYINDVEGDNGLFIVKDGVIKGLLEPEDVVVLTEASDADITTVHFNNTGKWENVTANVEGMDEAIKGVSENDGWYLFYVQSSDFTISFTDGTNTTLSYNVKDVNEAFITPEKSEIYESKEQADDALGVKTVSAYFYNTFLWENICAHAWITGGDSLTTWPGNKVYDEGGNWYRADFKVPKDLEGTYNVIFNQNGSPQTQNIEGIAPGSEKIYFMPSAEQDGGNIKVDTFSSKEDAETVFGASQNSTTVYFYNKDNWEKVYAYTWEACSFGEWPGKPAEADGDGWYKITVPAGAGANLKIIFNNGNNGRQTGDLTISNIRDRYVCDDRIFASKKEALGAPEEEIVLPFPEDTDTTTIYYYDDNNWGKVYAYVWSHNSEYNNTLGGWPGLRMYSEGNGWYYTYVPTDAIEHGELKFIANYNGKQIEDKEIVDTTNVYFNTKDSVGYASKQEAHPENNGNEDPGEEKPGETTAPDESSKTVEEAEKTIAVAGVTLNKNSVKIGKGGTFRLIATVTPENATDKELVWTSSNTKIATVSAAGLIKANKKGKCVITVTTKDGNFTANCKVTVKKAVKVTGVKLNKKNKTLKVGKTYTLKATVKPKNATIKDVKWSSGNKKVATVDSEGNVTAISKGTAVITVKTKDGAYKATCKIKVK
ncbi:MAG: starch-binding protein [Butyrivibrio sp.]|nr:starch-binding protein [Butyrivibrio sp.]